MNTSARLSLSLLAAFVAAWVSFITGASAANAQDAEIDTRPLDIGVEVAFPNVKWPGWTSPEESGTVDPLRPILVTHARDESNRVFIPTQQGVIYVLPNDDNATTADVFLDIEDMVSYSDRTNEEGFLGLTFHPNYEENGQFFVYYTNRANPHQNVISRYRVSADNANRADPDSEEIIMVLDKPFWNHDGGTIEFGPDGYLYIAVGDGGLANDPFGNGQNLSTLLATILRIDVDNTQDDLAYAIPADNPFVDTPDARGEIWAYGLRNVWRFGFDAQNGTLWAADVGQDTWEEIDIIVKGGNYGWNIREGMHDFSAPRGRGGFRRGRRGRDGQGNRGGQDAEAANQARPDNMIEPVFEYHHDIGKSITGGSVYRGKAIPELDGAYLYADYVSGQLWALWYDAEQKKVTANREIPLPASIPIMSFGEDENGEVYFTTYSAEGRGVYRLVKADE